QPARRQRGEKPRIHDARTEPVRRKVPRHHAQGPGHLDHEKEGRQMSRLRWWRRHDEIPVSELGRTNPVRFAVVFLIILALALYFGVTKHVPFKHGFKLNAVFNSALNIKTKSPVRIAGVDVGTVTHVRRQGNTGVVTYEISSGWQPINSGATVKFRLRIYLNCT